MSDFWSRALVPEPQAAQAAPTRAWWQDPPAQWQDTQREAPAQPSGYGQPDQAAVVQRLRKVKGAARNLSPEEAETIARFDLEHKAKYHVYCPQCGSGNYIPVGTRVNGVTMPTEKCFECGLSARGPEMAIGGSGGGGQQTRQIDTGGYGGQSMFMAMRSTPAGYMPRGS